MPKILTMCLAVILSVCLISAPGCTKPTDNGWTLEKIAPIIKSTTTLAATAAFNDPNVATHKAEICAATQNVVNFLNDYNNPDTTFTQLKTEVLNLVDGMNMNVQAKQITKAVTEFILDSSWVFVRNSYLELVNKDESQVVLLIAKSVASGIQQACGTGVSTFGTEYEPLQTYLDKYPQ